MLDPDLVAAARAELEHPLERTDAADRLSAARDVASSFRLEGIDTSVDRVLASAERFEARLVKEPQKAPEDSGAFGHLRLDEQSQLEGAAYFEAARLAKNSRSADAWRHGFLTGIHRRLFYRVFPEHAGILRQREIMLRDYVVPTPGQILNRMADIADDARALVANCATDVPMHERVALIMPQFAPFYPQCVVAQSFIDGNKRWSRLVLRALFVHCGFFPGVPIDFDDRSVYLNGLDKAYSGNPDQLANLLLRSWIAERQTYRMADNETRVARC